jgi:hypothetical protein
MPLRKIMSGARADFQIIKTTATTEHSKLRVKTKSLIRLPTSLSSMACGIEGT